MLETAPLPGVTARPLVDPIPLYPWSMVHRDGLRHRGLAALHRAIDQLTEAEGWLDVPGNSWLPPADRKLVAG
jgi:hypothetical protein